MSFQSDLKRYKARHYSTVKEIGELLGVSQRTAYRLLNGEKVPSKAEAANFAEILAKRDPDFFEDQAKNQAESFIDKFTKLICDLSENDKKTEDYLCAFDKVQRSHSSQIKANYEFMMLMHKDLREQKVLKESGAHIMNLSLEVEKAKKSQRKAETEMGIIWSELHAQKAEIDRLSQSQGLWHRIVNFIRCEK